MGLVLITDITILDYPIRCDVQTAIDTDNVNERMPQW